MNCRKRFGAAGTAIAALFLTTASPVTHAETVATVNGITIDSQVLEVYIASRLQDPNMQLTPEQRSGLLEQLKDVYLLSSQDAVSEIEKDPEIQAQIELQRIGVLAQAYIDNYVSNMTITDEEINTTYNEQVVQSPQKEYKARHILVATQGEAVEIIEALIAGADFAELATERSSDGSASSGGDLGWFPANRMVQPFAEAVVRLGDGRYTTDPVQTQFGWHVILKEGTRDAPPPPLDSVRNQIYTALQQQKLQVHLAELRTAAE